MTPVIQDARDRQRRRRRLLALVALAVAAATGLALWQLQSGGGASTLVLKVDFATKPPATRRDETRVARALRVEPGVARYRFVSKAEALATMKRLEPALVRNLPYNPLPDSYEVTLRNAGRVGRIERRLRSLPGVEIVVAGHLT